MGRTAVVVLAAAFLPFAGCIDGAPPVQRFESFAALYAPLGTSDSGFSVELAAATLQADRDLRERLAYTLRFGDVDGPAEHGPTSSLDAGFRQVREATCLTSRSGGWDCASHRFTWPKVAEPAPWGIGWTVSPPAGAERTLEGPRTVIVLDDVRYEYDQGRLAPTRMESAGPGDGEEWGYLLVAYDVLGPLGPADDWPEPPLPLANETRDYLVHPGEDQDFLGTGWTTQDAMAHLATDPEAGPILREGGCVLRYSVWESDGQPAALQVPMVTRGGPSVNVWLQDREGASTAWSFYDQGDLLGEPRFSDPEGDPLWPFRGEPSCEERRQGPAPRLPLADAWTRSRALVTEPEDRGSIFSVYHMPPDHGHGGFSPGNVGLEAEAIFFPADDQGYGSGLQWDLLSGTLVGLMLT
ncbi:MAG TPA: hypothetical protein VJ874_04500, partial [Candidatus Thermoplasmatota archaeon]|nr:hypothetical protein [Candidatus Thermoplasmatota archaeon]